MRSAYEQQTAQRKRPWGDKHQIVGGQIFFGGGVPLYNAAGEIIGGLGISGDTLTAGY